MARSSFLTPRVAQVITPLQAKESVRMALIAGEAALAGWK